MEKQEVREKKMKIIAKVNIPQDAFSRCFRAVTEAPLNGSRRGTGQSCQKHE